MNSPILADGCVFAAGCDEEFFWSALPKASQGVPQENISPGGLHCACSGAEVQGHGICTETV